MQPDNQRFTTPDYSSSLDSPSATHQPYTPTPPPDAQSSPSIFVSGYPSTPASSSTAPVTLQQVLADKPPAPVKVKPPYIRPVLAPNGRPWPITAGYIKGLPQKNTNGHCEITIDNSQSDGDVFIKVVALADGSKAFPIRQFFVPAHGRFVVKNIRAGSYDVRELALDSGAKSGSPSFELTETQTQVPGGVEYEASRYELTLYNVVNGNMKMRALADDEF